MEGAGEGRRREGKEHMREEAGDGRIKGGKDWGREGAAKGRSREGSFEEKSRGGGKE